MHPKASREMIFLLGGNTVRCGKLLEQGVDVRRELDSLVTQMHSSGIRYDDAVREFKRQYLREVLVANRGNQCKAAEELGIHRNTLSRTMAELGLSLAEVTRGPQASAAQRTSYVGSGAPGLSPGLTLSEACRQFHKQN